jgi:hypothetical protein
MIYGWHRNEVHLLIDTIFKELDGIHEAVICHCHDQINGVEVFLTVKASCEVGLMIGCRMKIVTQRASESEYFVVIAQLKVQ